MTSVQNENEVLHVRRRPRDLNTFISFVLQEKFYWKKSCSWIQNVCCLSSLTSIADWFKLQCFLYVSWLITSNVKKTTTSRRTWIATDSRARATTMATDLTNGTATAATKKIVRTTKITTSTKWFLPMITTIQKITTTRFCLLRRPSRRVMGRPQSCENLNVAYVVDILLGTFHASLMKETCRLTNRHDFRLSRMSFQIIGQF